MDAPDCPPGLEPRFRQPEGWRWGVVHNEGRALRCGCLMPVGGSPAAIVVGLQGLSEFAEKYFETARDMSALGLGFWMMDWRGQGRSERYFPDDPERRHADDFGDDAGDLHRFIEDRVRPAARRADGSAIPLVMLAHSMGGNIGLRYMEEHPDAFACAAMTAPLFGIGAVSWMPGILQLAVSGLLAAIAGHRYTLSAGPWNPVKAEGDKGLLSSDPERSRLLDAWFSHDRALRAGGVTYGWVRAALHSCARVTRRERLEAVKTPVLIAVAGKETLVDNAAIRRAAAILPLCHLLDLPESRHEILMERDALRHAFLEAFHALLSRSGIKSTLRPAP